MEIHGKLCRTSIYVIPYCICTATDPAESVVLDAPHRLGSPRARDHEIWPPAAPAAPKCTGGCTCMYASLCPAAGGLGARVGRTFPAQFFTDNPNIGTPRSDSQPSDHYSLPMAACHACQHARWGEGGGAPPAWAQVVGRGGDRLPRPWHDATRPWGAKKPVAASAWAL